MATITATNSATPSLQTALVKSRLDAAKRETNQAQDKVQALQAQTDAAESELQKSQRKVQDLTSRASETDPTYKSNVQASSSALSIKTQELLYGLYNATSAKRLANGNSLKTNPLAAPVLNPQGQATGRIVNISA
jgi:chromosome segregation ATPase